MRVSVYPSLTLRIFIVSTVGPNLDKCNAKRIDSKAHREAALNGGAAYGDLYIELAWTRERRLRDALWSEFGQDGAVAYGSWYSLA
mmetsp:Transcript_6921/g.16962  ORF Transcript_6921/g.16962 Transcript_6921/m.16962 type:complete len:86 (+) Transcript_6921:3077-3334(+)